MMFLQKLYVVYLIINLLFQDWGDYTPKLLQTPISKQLKSTKQTERRQLIGVNKRRPQLTSSKVSLESLHDRKKEAISVQIDHASKERDEASTLFNINLRIKQEILKQEKIKTKLLLLELKNKTINIFFKLCFIIISFENNH